MTFRWTDRAGVEHELTEHKAIDRELRQVKAELLALRDSITHSDDDAFLAIHEGMDRLRARFFVLQEDLARFVRHEAARAIAVITKIDLQASFIGQLHRCYDQHAQRRDDNTAMCASPSSEQIDVLKQQAIHDGKPTPILATFGEAHAVLLANPATCRTPLHSTDGTIVTHGTLVLENLLDAPGRQLSALEQRALLVDFRNRHPHLRPTSEEFQRTIRSDPYFNALQVKYGYAMTCHKAQGGEWKTVVVDFNGFGDPRNEHFFRWAYTAITRAAESLVLINPPEFAPYSDQIWRGKDQIDVIAEQSSRDLSGDPDWDRFSFSSSIAPLMEVHQKLRAAWNAQSIEIDQLRHLDYCERYTLTREGKRASVQYHYNGQFKIGRSGESPGSVSDRLLADEALVILGEVAGKKDAIRPDAFIQEFLDLMDRALAGSPIARTGVELSPYRLRVSVADASRRGDIDFSFNSKSTWTAAQEVGGPGRTKGLYEDVQRLMSTDAVSNS